MFIDFTAAWCLTCQVNERVALRRTEVSSAFKEKGIAAFKADWTDRNNSISLPASSLTRCRPFAERLLEGLQKEELRQRPDHGVQPR